MSESQVLVENGKEKKKAVQFHSMDGNEAAVRVAYRMSDLVAIYPITPSTPMAESSDEWSAKGIKNLWGETPRVIQMQSEAGVAGTLHGMLQGGALATTFTASQGLLLMIPAMYKIAGQLMPFCMHVTARSLATHALSIFGDHSDVMAVRQTGFAMLASGSVQEAHDLAAVSHAATLKTRVPFLHFFDGFRTSHEINDVELLSDEDLRSMLDESARLDLYRRALTPDRPVIRGTAHNPDTYFQGREAVNPFYAETPRRVQEAMDHLGAITGRNYRLFDYDGDPEATEVMVIMGSGGETAIETSNWMNEQGARTGVVRVRLFRPFDKEAFLAALPVTVKHIVVMDRTKEPGALGEPLYLEVEAAFAGRRRRPSVVGGRYGLGSKEFNPAMVKSVFEHLVDGKLRHGFTVGIDDDVSGSSIPVDSKFSVMDKDVRRCLFYGLGSDGTVGANKNTIKIISKAAGLHAQAYFVYDSKKSGGFTVSHLRFGPRPIKAPYLIGSADFVGCHQWSLLDQLDIFESAAMDGTVLLNTPFEADRVWDRLSIEVQKAIISRRLRLFVIDAGKVARECGLGGRINTIMQTCFFALSKIIPLEKAVEEIKGAIHKSYSKKGEDVVVKNCRAVDLALDGMREVEVPARITSSQPGGFHIPDGAPTFVHKVTAEILRGRGDNLPVGALPVDGTWPMGTSKWEKRNLAAEIPVWNENICIQCNKCVLVCPHAAIRSKYYDEGELAQAPEGFKSTAFRSREQPGKRYTIQVAPEDCTGCSLCLDACPAKDKSDPQRKALVFGDQKALRDVEKVNFDYFLKLPDPDRTLLKKDLVKDSQFMRPLFEFSGACTGCGETAYIKLVTQMFGDRALIANATGCSSIYGGSLPTTPYTVNHECRGPAWANSLFEDNAEFGLGLRLSADMKFQQASHLIKKWAGVLGDNLVAELLESPQASEQEIANQRQRVAELRRKLPLLPLADAAWLEVLADDLVKKSVWIVGGDGWAYDIGFGGLDHILSLGENVNILVLDTEVYSNTGGQQSKATPKGAVAKFATGGKARPKKDLGLLAMSYGDVYVARVALGAKDSQTVKAIADAESYPGTSLVIAYAHCIAHGLNMARGLDHQKDAVASGHWPIYRYDPRRAVAGESPLILDSKPDVAKLGAFEAGELRFRMLQKAAPERASALERQAESEAALRWKHYEHLAQNGSPRQAS